MTIASGTNSENSPMTCPSPATLYMYTDPAFQIPTPEDVRAVIGILDLTADQVAGIVRGKGRTRSSALAGSSDIENSRPNRLCHLAAACT